ncbi:hypothetical protein CAPTEDRAFT_226393 [Capitella teleta]|uniref:Aminopeptidase n=1 Tax=Capitella teleta TaxID=283909 RepID=R7UJJ6_CAPTE|nr:hypothetical protein CAPTEDRAFT_226393 [Capitella teleta]|eukprot:ELU06734.1 hypothetical protein CAPTEDRAFT_226393 [Capitella teleta]
MARISLCVVVVLCFVRTGASEQGKAEVDNGLLPGNLVPSHYNLELQANMYDTTEPPFELQGSVEITFLCLEATGNVVLHSVYQIIEVVSLVDSWGLDVDISGVALDAAREFLTISVDSILLPGEQYTLRILFMSNITISNGSNGQGFNAQFYTEDNERRYILWSELAYMQARKVFPCFDEPRYKATFDVILLRHPGMTSLFNTHLMNTEQREGVWLADHFATTPVMSTYLLCFVVCDFPHVEMSTSNEKLVSIFISIRLTFCDPNAQIRVYARREFIEAADFALTAAVAAQEWFEQYTALPNPTSKTDHIAIPGKGGAMESWGLITYSEEYLLWDENWSSPHHKLVLASIISHELAHQWFGNLVTNAWWDDHWLNEGTASFFETMPIMQDILGMDPSKIQLMRHMFRELNADKSITQGPVMIDMESSTGRVPITFAQYSKKYLTRFSYSSVVSDDLWNVLSEQAALEGVTDQDGSPLDLKEKFDPWLQQRGYPLIHASWDPVLKSINLTQDLYNPRERYLPSADYNYKWNIPLTFGDRSSSASVPEGVDIWMDREDSVVDGRKLSGSWILINIGARSLCRVKYDHETFGGIIEQLNKNHEAIHPESRALLVDDVIDFERNGMMSAVDVLEILQYLGSEMEMMTWKQVLPAIDFFSLRLRKFPETWKLFQRYLRSLVDPVFERVSWYGQQAEERLT